MGWVKRHLAIEKPVHGVIVAASIDERLKYAAVVVPDVSILEYEVSFKLNDRRNRSGYRFSRFVLTSHASDGARGIVSAAGDALPVGGQSINRTTTDSVEGHAHVVNPRRLARQPRAHRRCSTRGKRTSARRSGEDLAHPHQDMWCRHPAGQRRSGGPVRAQLRKPRCEPDAPATTPFRVERARVR